MPGSGYVGRQFDLVEASHLLRRVPPSREVGIVGVDVDASIVDLRGDSVALPRPSPPIVGDVRPPIYRECLVRPGDRAGLRFRWDGQPGQVDKAREVFAVVGASVLYSRTFTGRG